MARLLRALGLTSKNSYEGKQRAIDGNASDTDADVGCNAIRRSVSGSRKKPSDANNVTTSELHRGSSLKSPHSASATHSAKNNNNNSSSSSSSSSRKKGNRSNSAKARTDNEGQTQVQMPTPTPTSTPLSSTTYSQPHKVSNVGVMSPLAKVSPTAPAAEDRQSNELVGKCAVIDTDYSLPADWRTAAAAAAAETAADELPAYSCVEAYGEPYSEVNGERMHHLALSAFAAPLLDSRQHVSGSMHHESSSVTADATTTQQPDARNCNDMNQPSQPQLYDAPWATLDSALLQKLETFHLEREREQREAAHRAAPINGSSTLRQREMVSTVTIPRSASLKLGQYALLPTGRTQLEPSEQSAFERVLKTGSGAEFVSSSPAVSSSSSLHVSACWSPQHSGANVRTSKRASDACSTCSADGGRVRMHSPGGASSNNNNNNNNSLPLDYACSHCCTDALTQPVAPSGALTLALANANTSNLVANDLMRLDDRIDVDKIASAQRLSQQDGANASEKYAAAPPERVLPRMGLSAVKARGSIATSASTSFQSRAASTGRAATTMTNSASFNGQSQIAAAIKSLSDDSPSADADIWLSQQDSQLVSRRRHSQNATDVYAQRHRSAAEGPYDCPWDDRRERLEALLLNNVGVDLTTVLRSAQEEKSKDRGASETAEVIDSSSKQPQPQPQRRLESSLETERFANDASRSLPAANSSRTSATRSSVDSQSGSRHLSNLSTSEYRQLPPQSHSHSQSQSQSQSQQSQQLQLQLQLQQRNIPDGSKEMQACRQVQENLVSSPHSHSHPHSNSESPGKQSSQRERKQKSTKKKRDQSTVQQQHSGSPASSASSGPSASPLAVFDSGCFSSANDLQLLNVAAAAEMAGIIDPSVVLETQGWFYPLMTRNQAESLLQNEVEGSFLVRRCETCPQDFSLSIRNDHAQNGIVHMRISRSSKGYILGGYSQPYESVPVLVHHFMFYALPIRGVPSQVLVHPIVKSPLQLSDSSSISPTKSSRT